MGDLKLQDRCELGQEQLMRMEYLAAETTLADAEASAWQMRDFDTLSRLYLPLQEARRQRRQRCGEGVVCLDLIAESADDHLNGREVVDNFSHGQLLVAGWGSIEPALQVRLLQNEYQLYVETFLAAVYQMETARVIAIVPHDDMPFPGPEDITSIEQLTDRLPPGSIVMPESELPKGSRRGTPETYGQVMAIWEKLHAPFLAAADAEPDLIQRIQAYRQVIEIDYACELAHQKLSDVAKKLARTKAI